MARLVLVSMFLILLILDASASCLPVSGPVMSPISAMIGRDPVAALRMAGEALGGGGELSVEMRGRLMAMQAESHGRLSQAEEARRIAMFALKQPLEPDSETRVELLWILSTNTFRSDELKVLRPLVERLAAAVAPESDKGLCLAIALGNIHRMSGKFGEAAQLLFHAYNRSDEPATALAHVEAARLLARLWGDVGSDASALELNQIVIDAETIQGNIFLLAMAHGFRGIYLNNLRRFKDAIPELEYAGASHRQFPASISEAYIDNELCRSFIGLGQWGMAREHCDLARVEFARLGEAGLSQAELLTAQIDLAENKIDDAHRRLTDLIGNSAGPALLKEF